MAQKKTEKGRPRLHKKLYVASSSFAKDFSYQGLTYTKTTDSMASDALWLYLGAPIFQGNL